MQEVAPDEIRDVVRRALQEDIGEGDRTTLATVSAEAMARGLMVSRERLVLAGLRVAQTTFHEVGRDLVFETESRDGQTIEAGQTIMAISGSARALLTAERVALNFVQRLSGIATLTARFVEIVRGTAAQILDTRKTTPGLRQLEKYAVSCGGGKNHRVGLYDMILIKDNHLAVLKGAKPNPIFVAVQKARQLFPRIRVEVEVDTLEQLEMALAAGADQILCDNMTPEQLRQAVTLTRGRIKLEASGGVNLQTVRAIAESGIDFISIGALTHSARAVDIALDFEVASAGGTS